MNPREIHGKQVNLFDLKRLLIQEKGEEDYYHIYNRKIDQLKTYLKDEDARLELKMSLEFYTKDQSRKQFQLELFRKKQEKL